MRRTIYHILNKCLLVILAIQLLNMSFNNLNSFFYDSNPLAVSDNQIDCAFEYITEHILGWDNYVPENRQVTNHQTNHLHKSASICWYSEPARRTEVAEHPAMACRYPLLNSPESSGHPSDINPPPPKTVG